MVVSDHISRVYVFFHLHIRSAHEKNMVENLERDFIRICFNGSSLSDRRDVYKLMILRHSTRHDSTSGFSNVQKCIWHLMLVLREMEVPRKFDFSLALSAFQKKKIFKSTLDCSLKGFFLMCEQFVSVKYIYAKVATQYWFQHYSHVF